MALTHVVVYMLACALWSAYASALFQAFFRDPAKLAVALRYERWIFVGVTAFCLYLLGVWVLTKRHDAEMELTESERTLSSHLGHLPGMAYRCTNDVVRTMEFVSEGCRELTGYRAEDFIANRHVNLDRLIHADDRRRVWGSIQSAVNAMQKFSVTYRITHASGEQRWVLEQGSPLAEVDGRCTKFEGLLVDITREKESERALKEQRQHLEEIVAARTSELTAELEERGKLANQLQELSTKDPLTGLYNRREMGRFLKEEMIRCSRYRRPLAVVMIDIDYFKRVNDTCGHQAGDDVLRWLAENLRGCVRQTDRACRYGGEELAVILPEADGASALIMAERLRRTLAGAHGAIEPVVGNRRITVSAGAAAFPDDAEDEEGLIAAADNALYSAKRSGRDRALRYGG